MKASKPQLTVIIATYNRSSVLIDTVKSVLEQDFAHYELLVLDQTDPPSTEVMSYFDSLADSRVRYFTVRPPALTAVRNLGIKLSRAKLLLFLDDDVLLDAGYLQAAVAAFSDPGVAALAGRIKNWAPGERPLEFKFGGVITGTWNVAQDQDCTSVQGCGMAFRKSVLEEIGGFDVRLLWYRDDTDIGMRVAKRGRIRYVAAMSLEHLVHPSGGVRDYGCVYDNPVFYECDMTLFRKHWPLR
ncbi:MAG TPA: glycosyltransferase family A protein, partial [Oligoflexia bacterium]|nr:glycosyltransferase family A protein [Oligoflexia bacterium]